MHDSSNTLNKMYYIRTLIFKNLWRLLIQIQTVLLLPRNLVCPSGKSVTLPSFTVSKVTKAPNGDVKGIIPYPNYPNKPVSHFSRISQQCHKVCPSFSKRASSPTNVTSLSSTRWVPHASRNLTLT